jgi:hypothetical protein
MLLNRLQHWLQGLGRLLRIDEAEVREKQDNYSQCATYHMHRGPSF